MTDIWITIAIYIQPNFIAHQLNKCNLYFYSNMFLLDKPYYHSIQSRSAHIDFFMEKVEWAAMNTQKLILEEAVAHTRKKILKTS